MGTMLSYIVSGLVVVLIATTPVRTKDSRAAPADQSRFGAGVVEVAQLTPSDASDTLGQGFGISAAIEGDWLAVGAPQDQQVEPDAGAVYIFRRDESKWVEHEKLVPDDGAMWGVFGGSLAMDGDRLVVGASFVGSTKEAVRVGYVFVHNNKDTPRDLTDDAWILDTKLLVPEIPYCCDLGPAVQEVGISGNRIVVGHPANWGVRGAVSIFEHIQGQWTFSASLLGSDTVAGDGFGASVSISGDRVAVSAYQANGGLGAVYVFRNYRGGWLEEAKVTSTDPAVLGFGNVMSFDGNYLAVDGVYVFRRNGRTWLEQAVVSPPQGTKFFGGWLFITGRNLFVWAEDAANNFWVMYYYERLGQEWVMRQRLQADDSSAASGYWGIRDQSGRYLVAGGARKVYVLQLEKR